MADNKGKQMLLGGLVGVAALVAYQVWSPTTDAPASSSARSEGSKGQRGMPSPAGAPDVHLHALEASRPQPVSLDRNLFRFKPKPAPAPPRMVSGPVLPPPAPTEPPLRLLPIPYRFIGIVEATERKVTIAVLTDGVHVVRGSVGDLLDGRFRILRIGPDSIEMAYPDGRGRQTIRLTGS